MNVRIDRRTFVALSGAALAAPRTLLAQPTKRVYRIAIGDPVGYVHRVLMGAKPADLPVEQSSNARMVLNLKTARAMGIAIPESVRLRVDEFIE